MSNPSPTTPTSGRDGQVLDRIIRYWDHRAPNYADHQIRNQPEPIRDLWREIWSAAMPTEPADVLDVGTGTGEVAVLLAELGHRVVGTDLSEQMLAIARQRAAGLDNPPELKLGDAQAPDFAPGSFDVVTCRYVVWTLTDPVGALRAWRKLLRPGGRFVTVDSTWFPDGIHAPVPNDDGPPEFQEFYDRNVASALPLAEADSIDPMVEMVEEAGFRDVEVESLPQLQQRQRELLPEQGHGTRLQFRIIGWA